MNNEHASTIIFYRSDNAVFNLDYSHTKRAGVKRPFKTPVLLALCHCYGPWQPSMNSFMTPGGSMITDQDEKPIRHISYPYCILRIIRYQLGLFTGYNFSPKKIYRFNLSLPFDTFGPFGGYLYL